MSDFFAGLALLFLGGCIVAAAAVLIYSIVGPFFMKSNPTQRATSGSDSQAQASGTSHSSKRDEQLRLEDEADEDELHH
ncbi:MAG: hypothetical protein RL009_403 [Actinomycetota bacterium]|jgi:hypothetical protein